MLCTISTSNQQSQSVFIKLADPSPLHPAPGLNVYVESDFEVENTQVQRPGLYIHFQGLHSPCKRFYMVSFSLSLSLSIYIYTVLYKKKNRCAAARVGCAEEVARGGCARCCAQSLRTSCARRLRALVVCPVLFCAVLSCPVLSRLSRPVLSCPVLPRAVLSCPVPSRPIPSCLILSRPVLSCPVLSRLSRMNSTVRPRVAQ